MEVIFSSDGASSTERKKSVTDAFRSSFAPPVPKPKEKTSIPINLQITPEDVDPNKWKCETCDIVCKAKWSWDLHIKSASHREKEVAKILRIQEANKQRAVS